MDQQQQQPLRDKTGLGGFRHNPVNIPSSENVLKELSEAQGSVRVMHGCRDQQMSIAGQRIGDQREKLRSFLNFDEQATALINGEEVDDDYVLKKSDTLEFLKLAGDKGSHK